MHDAVKNVKKQKYFDQLLQTSNLIVFNLIIRIENVFVEIQKLKKKFKVINACLFNSPSSTHENCVLF